MDKLHRTRMLLGDAAIEKLSRATVMVVGCGAVGSFAIEALARSGVGNIILVDFDDVATSNINRQLFATDSTVGRPKVDVAIARIHDINPDINVTALNMRWDATSDIATHVDFVIDAIDVVDAKIALYRWCEQKHIPFIASMGAARKVDPTQIRVGRIYKTTVCPLAARVRKMARENNISDFPVVYSVELPSGDTAPDRAFGSIVTVTGIFGLILANAAIMHIIDC